MVTSPSVGTICSSTPLASRASRTVPVVALVGTKAEIVWLTRFTVELTLLVPRLPLSSSVVKTSWSSLRSPVPGTISNCPTLAEASAALAAVPLSAVALTVPAAT